MDREQLKRWRLILGSSVQEDMEKCAGGSFALTSDEKIMDEALAAIYDNTRDQGDAGKSGGRRQAGLGSSSPRIARWLADIRRFFPHDVVSVIQSDAIGRKGLTQLIFEPETLRNVQPDLDIVATLMALKGKVPERTKETARQVVKAVVDEIVKKLDSDIRRAVTGALNRREHSPIPSAVSMDWKYTIQRNLKHYSKSHRKIIPERFYFFDRIRRQNRWTIILDMDQSGSMADSIIYGSVIGSIFASIPAISSRIVVFDTEVVDLTEQCAGDPVEMLFGIQLGGGTDINKSVAYCQQFITEPGKTVFILLSDLLEGGNQASLVKRLTEMHESGVKVVAMLALSDRGTPAYDENLAGKLAGIGIPAFACTPSLLPEFIEGALKGSDLNALASRFKHHRRFR
ncbi:MAG: VWA domain-containing protein [Candidatus Xenobiia bacterium LiM19]